MRAEVEKNVQMVSLIQCFPSFKIFVSTYKNFPTLNLKSESFWEHLTTTLGELVVPPRGSGWEPLV